MAKRQFTSAAKAIVFTAAVKSDVACRANSSGVERLLNASRASQLIKYRQIKLLLCFQMASGEAGLNGHRALQRVAKGKARENVTAIIRRPVFTERNA